MSTLRLIGYWRNDRHPEYPHPGDFVDTAWDPAERRAVADYLSSGTVLEVWRGFSPCRFCDVDNGFRDLTDGSYAWPEGLAHYLSDHGVRPPQEFVDHVLTRQQALRQAELSLEWWLSKRSVE